MCCITIYLLLLGQFVLPTVLQSVIIQNTLSFQCKSQTDSCSSCLNFNSECSWCFHLDFEHDRCDLAVKLVQNGCTLIYTGKKSRTFIEKKDQFRDVTDTVKNAIQIRPQKVKVQLRPGDTEEIKLKYRVAKNYPLDLYYLVDATYTMKDDLETLAMLGDHLTHSVANLTKYFRLGFGTFSDKVEMPFARMDEASFKNPCTVTDELSSCTAGFDFRHQYRLDTNISEFLHKVNSTKVTANLDNAEGAMDALMQVIVCADKIGWKNDSRKIVLLLTNGVLHFAGDGKLAGITKKADCSCHLDNNGLYTESILQDYPSLEQIYRKLKTHKINVIFAVTEEVFHYYKKLNAVIPKFTYVTRLHSDSSNILNVIKQGYEDVVSLVDFQDNSKKPVRIDYFSNCNKQMTKKNNTHTCYGTKEGEKYEFDIKITLENCPEDPKLWKQRILIDESHVESESLTIDVEMLCGCNCTENKNISKCNNHGTVECGLCKCDNGWSGENCECDISSYDSSRSLENKCRKISGNTTSGMCYGRGECICGKCYCEPLYTGKYCDCRKCDLVNGQECGGLSHGLCHCGTCLCQPGYTGPHCMCSLDNYECIAPADTEECSGHGYCKCGKCICDSQPFTYSGRFCEKCSTCAGLCHLYEKCAKCTVQNTCKPDDCNSAFINNITFVDKLSDPSRECIVQINNVNCPYSEFTYNINKNNTVNLEILKRSCSPPVPASYLASGAFMIVVILGIVTLIIYKITIRIADKRDYCKFMESLEMTKFSQHENPYYIDPITKHVVPENATFT